MNAPFTSTDQSGADAPLFSPIEIETIPACSTELLEANIRANSKRPFPFLLDRTYPKQTEPLAIVAGGPSLAKCVDELRGFKHIMVCGTAHDHLINLGFTPTYSVFCDYGPDVHAFRQKLQVDCTYLIATQCDADLFDHLSDCSVVMWDMDGWHNDAVFEGRNRVNGGSTAALRAPALALILGYSDLHFFGLDSSFEDDRDRHAYAYDDERHILPAMKVHINGKYFQTCVQFLAQAKDFQKLMTYFGHLFTATVHGEGTLMHEVWRDLQQKRDVVFNREKMK